MPFLIQKVEGGYAAFRPHRDGLVDPERPFVDAIDDIPLERWLEASREHACLGSPAMQLEDTARGLRELSRLRNELGLPDSPTVTVRLRGGGKTRDREQDRGAVYYARADGTKIEEKIFPLERPNGIGLSPDGNTLYVAETTTAGGEAVVTEVEGSAFRTGDHVFTLDERDPLGTGFLLR